MGKFLQIGDYEYINLDQVMWFTLVEGNMDKWEIRIRFVGDTNDRIFEYTQYNHASRVVNAIMDRNFYGKK